MTIASLDHRAVPFALAIAKETSGILEIEKHGITTTLGRQGLVEVAVALAAMIPESTPDVGGTAQALRVAVRNQNRGEIADLLVGRVRAQLQEIVVELARSLPADVNPGEALAWLD